MSSEEEILGNALKCKKMETLSRNSLTHDEEAHDEKAEKIVNEVESQDIFRKKSLVLLNRKECHGGS